MSRHPLLSAGFALMAAVASVPASAAQPAKDPASFRAEEGADLWRASKLVGVNIYGPDDRKVGDVTDVLTDHDGRARYIVVGVGGFLGLGQKDVAIPFEAVSFTDQPMAAAPAATDAAAPANAGIAPATTVGLGTPADTTGNPNAPLATGTNTRLDDGAGAPSSAPRTRSTAYPDHGTVALTTDQLKAAPTFRFAR